MTLTLPTYPSNQIKLPKLEIPHFNGDNVADWLFQVDRFFTYHATPTDHKLQLASFYMTGPALQWFRWMYQAHQLCSWDQFVRDLELRFGPSTYQNPEVALYKLRQRSSVTAYLSDFELLSNRSSGLSHENLLNCFLSGLRDDIRRELFILRPPSLHEAIGLAKLVEEKIEDNRRAVYRQAYPRPPPPNTIQTQPNTNPPNHRLPIRRLTQSQMTERRNQGLCFNCDDQYTPGHQCRPKFQCFLIEESDNPDEPISPNLPSPEHNFPTDPTPLDQCPNISYHAMEGHFIPSTLRITTTIHGKPFTALIDGGSTHNFMQTRVARFLHLPIEPARHLAVTVGNGASLDCEGFCNQTTLTMGGNQFSVHLHLLPIYGADIVLGVEWLAGLGPILFDYRALWLEFAHKGTQLRLCGLPPPSLHQLTLNQVQRLSYTSGAASFFQLITNITTQTDPVTIELPSIPPDTNPLISTKIQTLLNNFSHIFLPPKGLPPKRQSDHRIPLHPDIVPVRVRPYRYPHF